jgi:hypothetical protein
MHLGLSLTWLCGVRSDYVFVRIHSETHVRYSTGLSYDIFLKIELIFNAM